MKEKQIRISAEIHKRAKVRAFKMGVFLGEYVERLIRDDLEKKSTAKAEDTPKAK